MEYIQPNWPAPKTIKAYTTLRYAQGASKPPYADFNLASHVGDPNYAYNRNLLAEKLALPNMPYWLKQIHSTKVVAVDSSIVEPQADASYSFHSKEICIALTADCMPILLCNKAATKVACIHAGWRGLCEGIIENTIKALQERADNILIWLGPAISGKVYEVGFEVKQAFCQQDVQAKQAFVTIKNKYLLDLYTIAQQRLEKLGIYNIYTEDFCTYSQPDKFYSYRRDNVTGRMATLIWRE